MAAAAAASHHFMGAQFSSGCVRRDVFAGGGRCDISISLIIVLTRLSGGMTGKGQ